MLSVLGISLLAAAAGICIGMWANDVLLTKRGRLLFGGGALIAMFMLLPASGTGLVPLWWSVGCLFAFKFLRSETPQDVTKNSVAR